MEIVENYLKNKDYLNCVAYLREHTKNYNLMEILCEKIEKDDEIEKDASFWDNYAIVSFYLNKKQKSYNFYNKIFNYEKSLLTESFIKHYSNNLSFSVCSNMKSKQTHVTQLQKHMCNEKINFPVDQNYNLLNPSIVYNSVTDEYIMNVRTVNYKFDEKYRYVGDGNYNTINYIVKYDSNLMQKSIEKNNNYDMPYKRNFYGCEDARLFMYNNQIYSIFTSLAAKENPLNCMCLGNLEKNSYVVLDGYGKGIIQKNWTPLVTNINNLYFIYSFYPLIVLKYDENISNVKIHQNSLPGMYNKWRGGSQAISLESIGYDNLYICVVHESNFPKYTHRFVLLKCCDEIFEIYNYSPEFCFIDDKIEFCAGITISKNKENFILSFGKMDREIFLAKINMQKILNALLNEKQKIATKTNIIYHSKIYKNEKSPYTFVTCFFNLEKKETNRKKINKFNSYKTQSINILNKNINLVVYCDDDDIINHILNIRKKQLNKTKIIKIQIEELPYYKYYDKVKKLLTILMWSKLYFVTNAIKNNYFENNYYMWIDFGLPCVANFDNYLNCFYEKNEKISVMAINVPTKHDVDIFKSSKCFITSGLISGNRENFMLLNDKFDECLGIFLNKNIILPDNSILTHVALNNRNLFNYYYGDYDDIINNKNFMFNKKNIWIMYKNIDNCLKCQLYDETRLIIVYILKSHYNGHITLGDEEYDKLLNIYTEIFYL